MSEENELDFTQVKKAHEVKRQSNQNNEERKQNNLE